MLTRVLRIEKPHGRFGEGVFNVLDETMIEKFCPLFQIRLAHDPYLNEFRSGLWAEARKWRPLKKGLAGIFERINDPVFQRLNTFNWESGFSGQAQLRAIFRHPKIFPLMKERDLELHEFQLDEGDIFVSPHQALFYRPVALLVGRYDLETGDEITAPIKPDFRERCESLISRLFKPPGP